VPLGKEDRSTWNRGILNTIQLFIYIIYFYYAYACTAIDSDEYLEVLVPIAGTAM